MQWSLARQAFLQETRQPDEYINLERAALYMAQEVYPTLEVEEYINALETMAQEVLERLPAERYPLKVLQTINHYLFEDLKFKGNQTNYYDPRNSYLNDVIDRRLGIPITLALVYLAIARRVEFPMVGVGLPGHFLIRPVVGEMDVYVDVFHQGEILFPQDCQALLAKLYQQSIVWRPEFLEPVTSRQFLARMLGNLKGVYIGRGEIDQALSAIDRILMLFPDAPMELRDRGVIYFQLKRWIEARQDLEAYLDKLPDAPDRPIIQQVMERIEEELT